MTYQTWPLAPIPSHFSHLWHLTRHGIFYEGEPVSFMAPKYGANTCTVRDYHGNIVSSMPIPAQASGGWGISQDFRLNRSNVRYPLQIRPTPPPGGWKPGWYRAYLSGPNADEKFGHSYGVTNFIVIRADGNFLRLPASKDGFWGAYIPAGSGDTDTEADTGVGAAQMADPPEMITTSCLGLGLGRFSITNTADPELGQPDHWEKLSDFVSLMENVVNPWWLDETVDDPVRTRYPWIAFPNNSVDLMAVTVEPPLDWAGWLHCYVKDPSIDGTTTFIKFETGSVSGYKLTVRSPDSSTIVETYDNLATGAAIQTAVNGVSNFILVYAFFQEQSPSVPQGPTAIGDARKQGIIDVVQALYPLGIAHYEGPMNEPAYSANMPHEMRLFQDAVHAGNANAKAIGPCTVNITRDHLEPFFVNGVGDYCDEISFHDYNAVVNGDINCGRNQIEDLIDMLAENGQSAKQLWQTEANHVQIQIMFCVYHPRRTRVVMARTLLWEQYGVPFERNVWWYIWSHGFWSYSSWLFMSFSGDKSCNPPVATLCVYAQEVYGKNFHHRIDFGSVCANHIFLGNVYGDAQAGSVAAVLSASYIPDASVTFTVTGTAGPLTVVDGLGNESSVALSSGRITVDVEDIPTYVQLPAGANVSVYSVNDWGPSPNPNMAEIKKSSSLSGQVRPAIADGLFLSEYVGGSTSPGIVHSTVALPDSAEVMFYDAIDVERVLIWCGAAWQEMSTFIDFDVDTWDGNAWTTQKTVTKTDASSFQFGAAFTNSGTERETYWDEQWIFDVAFDSPVSCSGIRVYVREASYGGEPDALMINNGTYDLSVSGMADPRLAIQDIAVISGTAFTSPDPYTTEVLADSPVGYWRLGEPSGTTAASEVNTPTLDGTYRPGVILGSPGAITDGDTAVENEASAEWVTVLHDALIDVGDSFTVECWFKNTYALSTDIRVMVKLNNLWEFTVSPTLYVTFRRYGGGTIVASSTDPITAGDWYHLVVTKDGATTVVYVNGEDVTSAGTDYTFGTLETDLIFMGAGWESLDDVALYDTALTSTRVLAHYRAGLAPNPPTNTVVPTLEYGEVVTDTQVSSLTGRWSGMPTAFSYQWQRSDNGTTGWADLGGAVLSTYVIQGGDSGKYLRCGVIGSNAGGDSSPAYSGSVQVA